MLPEIRFQDEHYEIPKFDVESREINNFIDELKGFHEEFRDFFSRQEPRDNFFQYMVGQFSQIERKSIEPIALSVENAKVRAMQFFVSDVIWEDNKIMLKYRNLVNDDMGDPNSVLIFDETGFLKKGSDSAGVAKQYCGSVGKVDNCQVGVFASYASRNGYCLIGHRLFVPEKWFTNEYEERREKCKFPSDLYFKTKPQLAVELFKEIYQQNVLPFKYVVADSIYGNSPEFIDAVDNIAGVTYFVSMAYDTLCWLKKPITITRQYKYKGKILKEFSPEISFLEKCKPVYKKMRGWKKSTNGIRDYKKLPQETKDYLKFIQDQTGTKIFLISTGYKREETIWV